MSELKKHHAYWTCCGDGDDDELEYSYYFAPADLPPASNLTQRRVEAIIDIAPDGTLAGVELIDEMPPPPRLAQRGRTNETDKPKPQK